MASKPPVKRRDPLASGGVEEIAPELRAQLESRERRRARARKARRPKATYDLTMKIIDEVKEVATQEDVAQSDIVAWALIEFLERYKRGEVSLEAYKNAARSLRFACKLELPERWR